MGRTDLYSIIVNHEEQYSIVAQGNAVPKGWRTVGSARSKQECLDHLEKVWTQGRPSDWRRRLDSL